MTSRPQKHDLLQRAVASLHRRFGASAFVIVDHWEGDEFAIGIASPRDPRVLAHVAVDPDDPEHFFVELELPPQGITDIPYTPAGSFDRLTESGMAELIAEHLSSASVTGDD